MFKKKVLVILGSIVFIGIILYISKNIVFYRQYQDDLSITNEELKNKQVTPWGVRLIGQTSKNEKVIKVAILDSGVDKEHPDLKGKIIKEFNATNLPNTDKLGHGTAIAGILTANDNDIGIVGVRKNIEIYSAKVMRDNGKIYKQDFIKGFEWAILNDVDIINISLGFSKEFPELKELVKRSIERGIILVAASGNNYGENASYPAKYKEVISVGMINQRLKPLKQSVIGKIDFVAPGENILSTNNQKLYSYYTGASFSTAFITGVVAEYLSYENFTKNNVRQMKIYNCLKINSKVISGSKKIVGNGIPIIN
ncbi:S8 family serine peptidase [Bacillus sp. AFS029533]|uniref:S8 family serine peptidase n=1 Tax=Bacillus sp. AFS029533 TaxID=2033494 RepID=UPI0015D4AD22|nr:S8 family serine peptidase [Bacillus sp. AFS029533]